MKILLLFLLLPLTIQAKGFVCTPNPHDTQLAVSWNDKELTINVINPMGYRFMPQLETVGAASISFLKMQTEDLTPLDDGFTYRWPLEKCDLSHASEKLISCQSQVKADKETNITALGFTTAKLTEESLTGQQHSFRLRLSVALDKGNIYFVTIPFPSSRCY